MNIFKKTILGAALAVASSGAFAGLVNVAGVVWEPDALSDLTTDANMFESFASAVGQNVTGYGMVTQFNGLGQTIFCSACELTYSFSYQMTYANTVIASVYNSGTNKTSVTYKEDIWNSGSNSINTTTYTDILTGNKTTSDPYKVGSADFAFSGGIVEFFVDSTPDFNINTVTGLKLSNAIDGVSFLKATQNGVLSGSATNLFNPLLIKGSGMGYMNVVSGLAASYFDTNYFILNNNADLSFSSSFQNGAGIKETGYIVNGTVTFAGDSKHIPEPTSLALLGMGLLGFGASRMKKQA
ncbi:MAG: PEP-CTERM sorting domain-containing protein [Methylococcaceae bacterium]